MKKQLVSLDQIPQLGGPIIVGRYMLTGKAERKSGKNDRGEYDVVSIKHNIAVGEGDSAEMVQVLETFKPQPGTSTDMVFRSLFDVPRPGAYCVAIIKAVLAGPRDNRRVEYQLTGIYEMETEEAATV